MAHFLKTTKRPGLAHIKEKVFGTYLTYLWQRQGKGMTEKAKTLDSFCGRATFVPFLTPENQSLKEVIGDRQLVAV